MAFLRWHSFGLPKQGHTADEYEDALAGDAQRGRFAVADGASEALYAGLWARLLVQGFVHPPADARPESRWLSQLQRHWASQVDGLALPWYAEAKRTQGAFATFLGLVVKPSPGRVSGRWWARAVGDCNFFQVRDEHLFTSFPIAHAADFGNRPDLLCSRPSQPPRGQGTCRQGEGHWQQGDWLLLMTDALAHWFLRRVEAEAKPWQVLQQLLVGPPRPNPTAVMQRLRAQEGLRNDDVSLILVEMGGPS